MSVVEEVAEAKCPTTWHHDPGNREKYDHPEMCACGGTKLRWPTLSRSRFRYYHDWPEHRVPDVTLEKVLYIAQSAGWEMEVGVTDGNFSAEIWHDKSKHTPMPDISEEADTPLEAACAALLAIEE